MSHSCCGFNLDNLNVIGRKSSPNYCYCDVKNGWPSLEECEDTKGVINEQTMVNKVLHRKEEHEPPTKLGVNSGVPEERTIPAPLVAPVVLL